MLVFAILLLRTSGMENTKDNILNHALPLARALEDAALKNLKQTLDQEAQGTYDLLLNITIVISMSHKNY